MSGSKSATKPVKQVDYPQDRKDVFRIGMEFADLKRVMKRLAGVKEAGDTDEDADPEAVKGYTVAVAMAAKATIPDKKSPDAARYKAFTVDRRAVIVIRKKIPEAMVKKEMSQEIPGFIMSEFCYGRAFVDPSKKDTLVLDIPGVNRGLVGKLKKAIKGTCCSKVAILEGGQIVEVDEAPDDEEAQGSHPQATGETIESESETEQEQSAPTAPPPPPPPAPWNPAELQARLSKLIHEFAEAAKSIPDKVADLRTAADAARKAIATGVQAAATEGVDAFEKALRAALQPGGDGSTGASATASTLSKSGHAWTATIGKVQEEFGKLEKALNEHYGKEGYASEIQKRYAAKIQEIMDGLRPALGQKLEEASSAPAEERQTELRAEARKMLEDAQSYVVGNPLLTQLDENPFTPLQTKKLLNVTIGALKKSLA